MMFVRGAIRIEHYELSDILQSSFFIPFTPCRRTGLGKTYQINQRIRSSEAWRPASVGVPEVGADGCKYKPRCPLSQRLAS